VHSGFESVAARYFGLFVFVFALASAKNENSKKKERSAEDRNTERMAMRSNYRRDLAAE